jgi:hypothetical protein
VTESRIDGEEQEQDSAVARQAEARSQASCQGEAAQESSETGG